MFLNFSDSAAYVCTYKAMQLHLRLNYNVLIFVCYIFTPSRLLILLHKLMYLLYFTVVPVVVVAVVIVEIKLSSNTPCVYR